MPIFNKIWCEGTCIIVDIEKFFSIFKNNFIILKLSLIRCLAWSFGGEVVSAISGPKCKFEGQNWDSSTSTKVTRA